MGRRARGDTEGRVRALGTKFGTPTLPPVWCVLIIREKTTRIQKLLGFIAVDEPDCFFWFKSQTDSCSGLGSVCACVFVSFPPERQWKDVDVASRARVARARICGVYFHTESLKLHSARAHKVTGESLGPLACFHQYQINL